MTSQLEGSATFAVVGAGTMGMLHASILNGFEDASVVALVDLDSKAEAKAREIGAEWFSSTDALIDAVDTGRIKLDGVVVALANSLHEPCITWALERGIPGFTEKPIAHNLASAVRMVEAAERGNTHLMVGYHLPFHPNVLPKIAAAREGVGQVLSAKAWAIREDAVPTWEAFTNRSKTGGGPAIDLAHPLSVVLAAIGDVTLGHVTGTVHPLHPVDSAEVEHWAQGTGVVAHATELVTAGTQITFTASWRIPVKANAPMEEWGFELIGTRGAFEYRLPFNEQGKSAYPHQMRAFVDRVLGNRAWDDTEVGRAMTAQRFIAGTYLSARRSGAPVDVTGSEATLWHPGVDRA